MDTTRRARAFIGWVALEVLVEPADAAVLIVVVTRDAAPC